MWRCRLVQAVSPARIVPRVPPLSTPLLRCLITRRQISFTPHQRVNKRKSEEEWRVLLNPAQFHVLREKGTEPPYSGEYEHQIDEGVYRCAGCESPLYTSATKFASGCGWPAFFDAIPGAIERHEDHSYGMKRTEITCSACGGHLGHVFQGEGYDTPTDERHCVNSISLRFEPGKPTNE
ncbi:SelR-domain-containing protein [Basidiobolus meristosporus CBS 931.73]|uniref:Peptide-methionine (R)-S-oxide reductase n=1 Tax=Basidiobolus meristosporus CBS 931.73 TaxID=1314790 RepID=A0A1Y1XJ29_9FUNG|nr:SelR-domain-containing protein [Basidiobolus meristosporus CBS 931.73]|eukprot:ORX85374.1 SelR-domain-containing protein [Basidiobolus meristosporus CBS 931.73]